MFPQEQVSESIVEQSLDVSVPHIVEESGEIQFVQQGHIRKPVVEAIVGVPIPHVTEEIIEVVKLIPRQ